MDYGLIIDLETTGIDPKKDKIIEIGLLEFAAFAERPPAITRMYGSLQDPGEPITPEITKITGIQPDDVKGMTIDWPTVRGYFERATIVIAHNAAFDRAFLEATGQLEGLRPHWACSMRHVDWQKHGHNTLSLNYLAADHGFVNPFAHRALFDCATTFRIVAPKIEELIRRSYEREIMIRAEGSPFETKDALRARGYRWDSADRVWCKVVCESELEAERAFLASDVYKGKGRHTETIHIW